MPAAYEMREKLGKQHRVTVVSNSENFHFVPSNPWVGVKWRERKHIEFPVRTYLEKKASSSSRRRQARASDQNQLELNDGQLLGYDYLVIATGPKLAFEEVEGLGPHGGHTYSVCHIDHAMKSHDEWEHFCKNPGPIVVGPYRVRPASDRLMNTPSSWKPTCAAARSATRCR